MSTANGVDDAQRIWGADSEGEARRLIAGSGRVIVLFQLAIVFASMPAALDRPNGLICGEIPLHQLRIFSDTPSLKIIAWREFEIFYTSFMSSGQSLHDSALRR